METPEVHYSDLNVKKKSHIGLIIGILSALIVLAGGFIVLWLLVLSPKAKITKAMEENDIPAIIENYDKISDEELSKDIRNFVLKYARGEKNRFEKKEIEYDELEEELKPLKKSVLKGNDKLDEILDEASELNDSRVSFDTAKLAMESEDYVTAKDFFEKVSKNDKDNYEEAQRLIEECNKMMLPDISGKWCAKIDVSNLVMQSAGFDISTDDKLYVKIIMELNEDGTGELSLDADAFLEDLKPFAIKIVNEILEKECKDRGFPADYVDQLIQMLYGKSKDEYVKEYIDEYLNENPEVALIKNARQAIESYEVISDNEIKVNSVGMSDTVTYSLTDDNTLIISEMGASSIALTATMGIDILPIEFKRQ